MVKILVLDESKFELSKTEFDGIIEQIPTSFLSKNTLHYTAKNSVYILGRLLLSRLASEFDNIDSLKISYNEHGKPYFINSQKPLYFNISHSKDMVICAVSDTEIGIDIQKISDCKMEVVKRFFADSEYEYLSKIDDQAYLNQQFTKLWCMKESIVKCKGEALGTSLKKYSFKFKNEDFEPDFDTLYNIKCINFDEYYIFSYCSQEKITNESLIEVTKKYFK